MKEKHFNTNTKIANTFIIISHSYPVIMDNIFISTSSEEISGLISFLCVGGGVVISHFEVQQDFFIIAKQFARL